MRPLRVSRFPQLKLKHYSIVKVEIPVKLLGLGRRKFRELKLFFRKREADAPVDGVKRCADNCFPDILTD